MSIGLVNDREELLSVVSSVQVLSPRAYRQVMREFLKAVDFQDPALVRAHLNAACDMLAEAADAEIQNRREWPRVASERCQAILAELEGQPLENVDDYGKSIETLHDRMINSLTELRDECVVPLKDRGIEVDTSNALDATIQELRLLKIANLKDWPWSDRPLPPVNRKMIQASRASIQRGQGENVKDLIARLSGIPSKG